MGTSASEAPSAARASALGRLRGRKPPAMEGQERATAAAPASTKRTTANLVTMQLSAGLEGALVSVYAAAARTTVALAERALPMTAKAENAPETKTGFAVDIAAIWCAIGNRPSAARTSISARAGVALGTTAAPDIQAVRASAIVATTAEDLATETPEDAMAAGRVSPIAEPSVKRAATTEPAGGANSSNARKIIDGENVVDVLGNPAAQVLLTRLRRSRRGGEPAMNARGSREVNRRRRRVSPTGHRWPLRRRDLLGLREVHRRRRPLRVALRHQGLQRCLHLPQPVLQLRYIAKTFRLERRAGCVPERNV